MRTVVLCIAMIGLGVGGGYLLASSRAPSGSSSSAPAAVPPAAGARDRAEPAISVSGRGLSEADLRRVVREEIAAGQLDRDAAGAPLAAPPAPHPPDPAAFDDGMRRVNQAIAQRSWTRADAAALRRTLDTVSPEQRTAILHALIPALNRGEIKLAYRGELF